MTLSNKSMNQSPESTVTSVKLPRKDTLTRLAKYFLIDLPASFDKNKQVKQIDPIVAWEKEIKANIERFNPFTTNVAQQTSQIHPWHQYLHLSHSLTVITAETKPSPEIFRLMLDWVSSPMMIISQGWTSALQRVRTILRDMTRFNIPLEPLDLNYLFQGYVKARRGDEVFKILGDLKAIHSLTPEVVLQLFNTIDSPMVAMECRKILSEYPGRLESDLLICNSYFKHGMTVKGKAMLDSILPKITALDKESRAKLAPLLKQLILTVLSFSIRVKQFNLLNQLIPLGQSLDLDVKDPETFHVLLQISTNTSLQAGSTMAEAVSHAIDVTTTSLEKTISTEHQFVLLDFLMQYQTHLAKKTIRAMNSKGLKIPWNVHYNFVVKSLYLNKLDSVTEWIKVTSLQISPEFKNHAAYVDLHHLLISKYISLCQEALSRHDWKEAHDYLILAHEISQNTVNLFPNTIELLEWASNLIEGQREFLYSCIPVYPSPLKDCVENSTNCTLLIDI